MDYEKKYKEALEKARLSRLQLLDIGEEATEIEYIFPELKESKDERIKKAITHILYENYTDAAVIEGVEISEIVAWLEKQGDYNRLVKEIKERKELISKEKKKATSSVDRLSLGGRIAALEELLAFTKGKQSEQKPVWSKEDEKMLGKCIDAASGYYSPEDKEQMKEWLKSLKPQNHWKPTDEQMEDFKLAMVFLEDYGYTTGNIKSLYEQLKKL